MFVHVWAQNEAIYTHGRPDPHYSTDSRSTALLEDAAHVTGGSMYDEHSIGKVKARMREILGSGPASTGRTSAYARTALAPWFALAGVLPLAFLLYRRNL